jgi:hypothetical protein
MPKITPFLKKWKIGNIRRYGEAGPGPKGSVMSVDIKGLKEAYGR